MENSILEYFKLLLDLGIVLRELSDGIKTRSQKKIEKQLQGIIIDLKKILDEAERIIILVQAIDEKVKEYGESNFIKILQGNVESQIQTLSVIVKKISDSKFIKEIDDKLAIRLKSLVRFEMDNLGSVLLMLLYGKFIVENNQIYLIFGNDKHLVFSKLDEQKEILSQIKECSQSLASHIK